MRSGAIFIAILLLQLLGCTTTEEIVIDERKVNSREYNRDLEDCRRLATQVDAKGKLLKGAVSGAVIGGVSGAINDDVLRGATTGGILGGVTGLDEVDKGKLGVVKNCLRHLGYIVLN